MQVNKSLKVLFVVNSIFVFAGNLFGPLYAIYVQGIDEKITTISISWSVFTLSTVLFMLLVAKFGDKIKRKENLLASGFLIRSISWLGYLFVTNIYSLIFIQVLLGLGQALGTPSWDAIFAKHLDGNKEIMDYSDWNIISHIMATLGIVVGGFIASIYGFNTLFVIMGSLALISFIGVMISPKDTF